MDKHPHLPVVLVAENDPDDRVLLQEAFEAASYPVDLRFVEAGDECLAYLNRRDPWEKADRPDLILLGSDTTSSEGLQVLQKIKRASNLKAIPVIVLAISAEREDVVLSYGLGANTFIRKPTSAGDLNRFIKLVCEYWFETCMLPESEP